MPGGGSKKGERRGGRKKGTPNRQTKEVMEILDSLGCDPMKGLALIANGEPLLCGQSSLAGYAEAALRPTFEQRLTAYKELVQYVYPKRKAVEHSGEIGLHEIALEELE